MSHFDYEASKKIAADDHPFYGLIMAAMRAADTENSAKLRAAWPSVWQEMQARYNGPAGLLPTDGPDYIVKVAHTYGIDPGELAAMIHDRNTDQGEAP